MIKKFMSAYELSRYLGVSKSKVYDMIKKKEIPFYKISNCVRFNIDEVEDWNLSNRVWSFKEDYLRD